MISQSSMRPHAAPGPRMRAVHAAMAALAIVAVALTMAAGPAGAVPAPVAVSATAGPVNGSTTNLQTVTFTLMANRPGTTVMDFGCSMDGAAMDACDAVNFPLCQAIAGGAYSCKQDRSYAGLAEGPHRFKAVASLCNLSDDCNAGYNWVDGPEIEIAFTVDRTAPIATIVSGPKNNARIKTAKATFGFVANEASTFGCGIDGKPLVSCETPLRLTKLKNGTHRVTIQAYDGAGNVSVPVTRTFKVKAKTVKKRCRRVHGKRKCTKRSAHTLRASSHAKR